MSRMEDSIRHYGAKRRPRDDEVEDAIRRCRDGADAVRHALLAADEAVAAARRYAASVALAQHGAEIIAAVDPDGGRFNTVAWELVRVSREDPALWEDLL